MITEGFSVVICCYNSSARLPATLKYIANLEVPRALPCELIIVDNACNDDTVEVAKNEWQKYPSNIDLIIVKEETPGLSYARRTGFAEAKYEFIVLCDDDNWLESNYLVKALEIFEKHPHIGVLGGKGIAICETEPPEWLQYTKFFATGDQAPENGPVSNKKVYGAGAIMRKSAYEKILQAGFKSLLTDRVKDLLSSGGDFEICLAIYIAGYEIWFDNSLVFYHYFPKERLTVSYYNAYIQASVKCLTVLDGYSINLFREKAETFYINKYIIKQILFNKKEYFAFKRRILKYPKDSAFGIFIRFRINFFQLRVKGLIQDYRNIYCYAKQVWQFKKNLLEISEI
jgi:glycosyltransferase involved in cell wall biosynthesis